MSAQVGTTVVKSESRGDGVGAGDDAVHAARALGPMIESVADEIERSRRFPAPLRAAFAVRVFAAVAIRMPTNPAAELSTAPNR